MRFSFLAVLVATALGCSEKELGVEKISPALGVTRGGEKVTIYGSGFDKEPMIIVYFGNARAEYTAVAGPDRLWVNTPAVDRPGRVDVRVISGDGTQFILRDAFEFVARNQMAECVNVGRALNGEPITTRKSIRVD